MNASFAMRAYARFVAPKKVHVEPMGWKDKLRRRLQLSDSKGFFAGTINQLFDLAQPKQIPAD